ncbi:hypothetical protein [Cystobacter ferrugineus]|uniref:Haloacid dehalogenase-like hydrolase n=1 Tax=Cystobacter ferrugineus TaxID=83449 RepID=A0A1L9BBU1_9BACT|nr:hypothetical protein [Cystobacter ferrugineus]OJH39663.1 hypothetical protein BON30_19465 [Cystobacter ferrugineus]
MASDLKTRVREGWQQTLRDILERARAMGPQAVLAFDLDSTLFDNKPRQARILREYGLAKSHEKLGQCVPQHWDSGFDMRGAMRNCGLSEQEVEEHYPLVRAFWLERFFTSDYCVDDEAIQGAAAFTHAVAGTGAHLVYVTGRHEAMRPGTEACMRQRGLPVPGEGHVHLLMKPNASDNDDAFKREAHARLGQWGTLIAAFDNEPTHANDYLRRFPQAQVIHLATDHSGRPVTLLEEIVSVPHFSHES